MLTLVVNRTIDCLTRATLISKGTSLNFPFCRSAVALAVLVLRGAALRRGMGQITYRDEATGRLRPLPSSLRRAAEWLVLRYPQAVRIRV